MSGKKLRLVFTTGLLLVISGCATTNPPTKIAEQPSPRSMQPIAASRPMQQVGFLETLESDELIESDTPLTRDQQGPNEFAVANDLASLEARARANHPAIVQQRARVQAARGTWVQAGLPMNPVAQYQSNEIGNDDSSGIHQLQINQTIVTNNKLSIARNVAAAEIQKTQAELARAELQTVTNVRTAFIATLIAQQRVLQSETLLSIARQSVNSVQIMVDGQEASRIDLLQAQTAADQAELSLQNAQANERARRRSLVAAIGDGQGIPQSLQGNLDALLPERPWDVLIGELVAASPEMAKNHSELERARRALTLACAQVTPNVTTQVGIGVDTATDNTFGILGVSLPLPIRNRNEGNIARAKADITAAYANVTRTELELQNRLANAVGRYQAAKQRVDMLQQTIIPRAEETLALSRQSFEAGETSFLALLTVQRTLSQTRLNVLDAIEQSRIAAAEIDGLLVTVGQ